MKSIIISSFVVALAGCGGSSTNPLAVVQDAVDQAIPRITPEAPQIAPEPADDPVTSQPAPSEPSPEPPVETEVIPITEPEPVPAPEPVFATADPFIDAVLTCHDGNRDYRQIVLYGDNTYKYTGVPSTGLWYFGTWGEDQGVIYIDGESYRIVGSELHYLFNDTVNVVCDEREAVETIIERQTLPEIINPQTGEAVLLEKAQLSADEFLTGAIWECVQATFGVHGDFFSFESGSKGVLHYSDGKADLFDNVNSNITAGQTGLPWVVSDGVYMGPLPALNNAEWLERRGNGYSVWQSDRSRLDCYPVST